MEVGLAAAWDALGSNLWLESARGVIATTPGGAVDDEEANWDFGDFPVRPWGGDHQRRAVLSIITNLFSQLGFPVRKSGLHVLKLAEAELRLCLDLVAPACNADDQGVSGSCERRGYPSARRASEPGQFGS